MELPGGVDMQSVHAGACFVWVGRWCLGAILGSILEYFGLPNPSYTHFGPPFGRNRGPKSCIVMECDLRCHSGENHRFWGVSCRRGVSEDMNLEGLARERVLLYCCIITILLHYTVVLHYCIIVLLY